MVPRWRSLAAKLKSRELGNPTKRAAEDSLHAATPPDLLTRLERWRLSPSLITAAELVEGCIVEGREREAIDAAQRLVTIDRDAAPLIREQAARLLKRVGQGESLPADLAADSRGAIPPRYLTRIHPYDPLAWVELALAQTIRGSSPAAERSMRVALSLAPDNRHVLRSAARMFLHQGEPDRALSTIVRSAATRSDPWLISSEISMASLADKPSRFLKAGTTILGQRNLSPRQITELAGAVATEEMISGNRKKSRRSFAQSMIDPTGSALAQGEWAAPQLGAGELVPETRLNTTFENAEAMAFHWFRLRRFDSVGEACERWHENDPFSIRPFEFGSVTASYVEDFHNALDFARRGLEMQPRSATLLNAYAFAAASLDQVDEATKALAKLKLTQCDNVTRLIAAANLGLIAFRMGDEATGRQFYNDAIEGFRREGSHEISARARIYLAREAIRASSGDWPVLLKQAQDAMSKFKGSEATQSLRLVEKQAAERQLSAPSGLEAKQVEPVKSLSKPTVSVSFTLQKRAPNKAEEHHVELLR
jgi:Tfp pilus assembly protein PilF